jgi:hypothetical protein
MLLFLLNLQLLSLDHPFEDGLKCQAISEHVLATTQNHKED